MSEIDYLIGEYEERMDMLQTALSQGNCTSFEEYRYTCGQIRGLEAACAIIADLKQRMEHSDE
jgi:hypothetical protein